MQYSADLHTHSLYSRATSKESNLSGLAKWARIKGINIVATGDFTHPLWLSSLKEELVPAEPGLFRLRNDSSLNGEPLRFILSSEISCIYKRYGKVRKVHNLLYVPDFHSADIISSRLASIGNIVSDGRPILGLDSHDLLEILLENVPGGVLIPAHIWTPWFSIFGSKSGFDSIEDCFSDLSNYIFALETGLSSDPAMNRTISALDKYALISNSDCHSPSKLGREANLFDANFDYLSLWNAIKCNKNSIFQGTVEFFPHEGKYHADGHRSCSICCHPSETKRLGGICPVCKKPLTIGVLNRIQELSDRTDPYFPIDAPHVYSLLPLPEILSELLAKGAATKTVMIIYSRLINLFGSELNLLLRSSLSDIAQLSELLSEAIGRMREGRVFCSSGYDGEFGRITIFETGEQVCLDLDPGILRI